jgi:hypothetical protein
MTETAPAYVEIPPHPPFSKGGGEAGGILFTDVSDQIIDFTLALQDYLANDPDRRATDLLATAVDIMDALLADDDRVLF